MDISKMSSISRLKILGCLVFDATVIAAFFKIFGLFIIVDPVKSTLILFVLQIGLFILNIVVVFSDMLFKSIGIPYSAATVTLTVLYVIISNILSVFLITGNVVWYIILELIIFTAFILSFAVIAQLSNSAAKDVLNVEIEEE
ncbi:MAG: hypothetical protein MUO60_03700 [Clostridiaceae bacterium]|nr:hypothetical protein [Clostridiaceae bacterium]